MSRERTTKLHRKALLPRPQSARSLLKSGTVGLTVADASLFAPRLPDAIAVVACG